MAKSLTAVYVAEEMKMLKTIKAKNFLSWESLSFDVVEGVTMIQGYNYDDNTPEGSGKSAILNALSWGSYGRIPKDAKIDDVIRDGQKSCEVRIELVDAVIVRSRKPNDLYIEVGDQKIKGKDSKETQQIVEELIGMGFETFCQSVYFAQNYLNKFITANQEDKGKILSEIQDLKIFDKARSLAHNKIKVLKPELLVMGGDLDRFSDLRDSELDKVNDTIAFLEEFKEQKKINLERLQEANNDTEAQAVKLAKEVDEYKAVDAGELKHKQLAHENTIETLDVHLGDLQKAKGEVKASLALKENAIEQAINLYKSIEEIKAFNDDTPEFIKDLTERHTAESEALVEMTEDFFKLKESLENPGETPCPTCGQDWEGDTSHIEKAMGKVEKAMNDKTESITRLIEAISERKQATKQATSNLADINKRYEKAEGKAAVTIPSTEDLDVDLKDIIRAKVALTDMIRTIQGELNEASVKAERFSNSKALLKALKAQMQTIGADYAEEEARSSEHIEAKIKAYHSKALDYGIKTKKLGKEYTKKTAYLNQLEILKAGYREVKAFVFQGILQELSNKANNYLSDLFEVPIKITFKNEDLKIATDVTIDGQTRPLGLYSGGQFRRICLAVDLALSDITASRKGKSLNLLVLDEYFKDLSEESMMKILELLQHRSGATLLIEHNSIFKSIVSNTYNVELIGGISREAAA